MSTASYLDQLLEPVSHAFTSEFAEAVVNLRLDEGLQQHVNNLRTKANSGTLTEEEDQDYKAFAEAVDVIGVIQSKARQFLARRAG